MIKWWAYKERPFIRKEEIFALDGIFVQIGLTANSALFKELLETNRMGEILTDKNWTDLCKRVSMLPEM